ncbi:hypothetical protein ACQEVS_22855 [Streptomyces sp. CA-181903]|uniref:imine reductase family protein n=1 Tax=Streptomyces sp. CA-181903 TaxID=3240055 RepID=UPI003D8FEA69
MPYARGIVSLPGRMVPVYAERADAGGHPGDVSNVTSVAADNERVVHASAARRGPDAGVLDATLAVARRAIDEGHGRDDFSRLVDTVRVA